MKPNLMIFTNGYEGTWASIEYGAWLARGMQANLTLIGVMESNDRDHPVEEIFGRAVSLFKENNLDYSLDLENGNVEETIANPSYAGADQLLIFGPFGRSQFRRMVIGNSFRHIMAAVSAPILYVPVSRIPLRQALICIGGLGYTVTAEHLGLRVAQMNAASVTLLAVVPPINIDYPEARKIRDNWQHLADTDTLTGRSLREGLENARKAGIETKIKIRHGNIVEQILAESKENTYDLICMGSQFSAHGLRQLYSPNITADVAETGQCPILTARYLEAKGLPEISQD
jgi:nucleotide-binding universal stress UspA family protein